MLLKWQTAQPHSQPSFLPSPILQACYAAEGSAAPPGRSGLLNGTCRCATEMSTSEEIPLQGVDDKKVEKDGKHVELQEQIAIPATSSDTKETAAPSQWSWKKIFTTVATLIAYAFLNAGISMIAPFYPIAVSIIFIGRYMYNVQFGCCLLVLGSLLLYQLTCTGRYSQLLQLWYRQSQL